MSGGTASYLCYGVLHELETGQHFISPLVDVHLLLGIAQLLQASLCRLGLIHHFAEFLLQVLKYRSGSD